MDSSRLIRPLLGLVLALPLAAPSLADAATPPPMRITTTEAFDASTVAPFEGDYPRIYAHIRANRDQHLENIRRWLRQPSISAEDNGVREMATLLRDDLAAIGFGEAELVETDGHPGVWGYYDAGAEKTLVVYLMYDVQPIEPTGWQVDAFDAALVEDHPLGKVLMARGASNQKGPERAFLNALQSIIAVEGTLPVNIMVAAEGEEELGSLHYNQIVDRYEARMREADGVFFPFNGQSPAGEVSMFLGVKGIVYFELEASGGDHGGPRTAEIHGSFNSLVDAPAWRLVQALSTLTSADGNTITVPGYYEPIRAPNAEEQRLFNGLMRTWPAQEAKLREALGVARWKHGLDGADALRQHLFNTTLNIDGLDGGYDGEGMKTILPHRAVAKLDSRLVPDQTPDKALELIRAHLDAGGFSDIALRKLSGYPPAQTSVEAPLVQAAIAAYRKHGITPDVAPRLAGSAPYYVFTQRLGLPMIAGGLGHGSGAHAPNEYMLIDPKEGVAAAGLEAVEMFYVDLLYALAKAGDTERVEQAD